jgi:hypothetical protein
MSADRWIAGVRLAAAPFALADVALEEFPPGDQGPAWTIAGVFAAGSLALAARPHRLAGIGLDIGVVSAFVVLYAFEGGTPVRLLLVLVVLEGALGYGAAGGALVALASVPALALFEWRSPFDPYDLGHVLGPFGILLLVGLIVGRSSRR